MARILIVDDRPINREFLVALMSHAGHGVQTAGDGAEALMRARGEPPDLVITDILMPVMDGVELARRLGNDPALAHVPVIFYTATYRLAEARELAASCGVMVVIAKPSEPQTLLDAVHQSLGLPPATVAPQDTPSLTGRHRVPVTESIYGSTVDELSGIRHQLRQAVEGDDTPSGKARKLTQLSTHLDASVARTQALSMRLAALVELGLELAAESSPEKMLTMFCHAARDILNARLTAACILDEGGRMQHFASWGMSDEQAQAVRGALDPAAGLLGELLRDGTPRRLSFSKGSEAACLPGAHPQVESLVAVPLKTVARTYGWFYAANRIGNDEFSDEDEQLAVTLASQVAPEFESLLLYDRLKRHAGLLQVESDERREALEQLRESELRFRQMAENIREVFFLLDAETNQALYVSPAYETVWDRSRESFYTQPDSWLNAVHPDDRERIAAIYAELHAPLSDERAQMSLSATGRWRQPGQFDLEYRIVRPDASIRWIKARGFPIFDANGRVYRIAGLAEDITQSKLQQLRIGKLTRIYAVLSGINSTIIRVHERQALFNEACRIAVDAGEFPIAWIGIVEGGNIRPVAYGGMDSELVARLWEYLSDSEAIKKGPAPEAMLRHEAVVNNDLRAETGIGPVLQFAIDQKYGSAIALPLLPDNAPAGVMVLYATEGGFFDEQEISLLNELAGDISFGLQYIAREEQLNYLAYFDSLTGLPNTTLFQERLGQIVSRRTDTVTAVFLVDLDRFTHLNDSLGRHVGDRLLREVGERLKQSVPEPGNLARITSDTFAVAVSKLREDVDAGAILQEKILGALSRPFSMDGTELRISARAGIAVHPGDGDDAATLFKNAEAALREAKASSARYLFYSPQLNARVADDLALEQKLVAAIEQQQFVVHYQPKVDARSGMITGLEALLRWRSPDAGMVSPGRFVPALEDSELILDVGRWVLERTLTDCKRWRQLGLRVPQIAVNVSPVQLRYADFAEMVLGTVERYGVSGKTLELEVTESVIMADIEANIERLQQISDSGVAIAIDDFGTGYSSLRYLAKLPVHALKIDRSFITAMTTDADSMSLVSTVISLAHSFDLTVVAEGVESEDQAKLLRLMKCDLMQGYLFGKPMPAEEIEGLLDRHDTG